MISNNLIILAFVYFGCFTAVVQNCLLSQYSSQVVDRCNRKSKLKKYLVRNSEDSSVFKTYSVDKARNHLYAYGIIAMFILILYNLNKI